MNRCVLLAVVAAAGTAASADVIVNDVHLLAEFPIGQAYNNPTDANPNALYSNIDNFTSSSVLPGGAALSPLTTNVIMDDVNMISATSGAASQVTFSVANQNTATTTARIRIRFWDTTGTGGGPGTLIAAFSFNPIAFAPGGSLFFFNPNVALPQNMWIGTFFDNSGATATTAAQLNNLGVLTFSPPVTGTSLDRDFLTAAPSLAPGNAPAGAIRPSPIAPIVANYGYEIIPSPSTLALLGLGGLIAGRRRRA